MAIRITRPTTTVTLATDMDARAEWESLVAREKALTREAAKTPRRLSQPADTSAELEQVKVRIGVLEQQMRAGEYVFTLTGLAKSEYRLLVAKHPPREGNAEDAEQRVNVSTFGDALAVKSITAVTDAQGAPVTFDPASEWGPLADEMTNAQWREFFIAMLRLNQQVARVPR